MNTCIPYRLSFLLCFILTLAFVGSCRSPIDIDSEKKVTHTDPPKPVAVSPESMEIFLYDFDDAGNKDSSDVRTYDIAEHTNNRDTTVRTRCAVDTSTPIPMLRLSAHFFPSNARVQASSYWVKQIIVNIDSLKIDGESEMAHVHGEVVMVFVVKDLRDPRRTMEVKLPINTNTRDEFARTFQWKVVDRHEVRLTLRAQAEPSSPGSKPGRIAGMIKVRY